MQDARNATGEELRTLVHSQDPEVLGALLENPHIEEPILIALLERKDLSGELLTQIARKKEWMRSYAVKLRVARHPHTPRLASLPLVKQLHLFDLVQVSLLPGAPAELKRIAEEQVITRLPQLPLGEKLTLARRGSARVAGALLAEGHPLAVPLCLDNAFLTEAQLLKVLSLARLPGEVVEGIARHGKWSYQYSVRLALVRHPLTPLARVMAFLPDLTSRDLQDLAGMKSLEPSLRNYIHGEIESRKKRGLRRAVR